MGESATLKELILIKVEQGLLLSILKANRDSVMWGVLLGISCVSELNPLCLKAIQNDTTKHCGKSMNPQELRFIDLFAGAGGWSRWGYSDAYVCCRVAADLLTTRTHRPL